MSHTVSETVHAAENGFGAAKDRTVEAFNSAKEQVESAREATTHGVSNALAMVVKGVTAAVGVISMLQKLDRDDGLAWLGLSRRKSPVFTVAVAGAGVVLGAGIALLFAPMAGSELRSILMGGAKNAAKKVETEVEQQASSVAAAAKTAKSDLSSSHLPPDAATHNGGSSRI